MSTTKDATASAQTLIEHDRLRALTLRDVVDPSPEYPDEDNWVALLRIAFTEYGEAPDCVYGVLLGVRACGAQLVKTEKGWTIQPRLTKAKKTLAPEGEGLERDTQWQTQQDYLKDREALMRWRPEVSRCLALLSQA